MRLGLYSKILGAAALLAMVALPIGQANAQPTIGDPTGGTFYGKFGTASGNPPGNWNITSGPSTSTGGTVELGLRATPRYLPGSYVPDTTSGIAIYTVATGAAWNYNFSINTLGTGHLSDLTSTLTISGPGGAHNIPFDVLSITDNNKDGQNAADSLLIPNTVATRAQNSENLSFGTEGLPGYSPWTAGEYTFVLTVGSGADAVTNTIKVNAVPEPASMALLGAGLLGLGLVRRRRRA